MSAQSKPVGNEKSDRAQQPHSEKLPANVQLTKNFFSSAGLWSRFARNPPVTSCREAANRRERLGYVGIPLSDELRSYVLRAKSKTGDFKYVLLHCRGTQSISFDAVSRLDYLRDWTIQKANLSELNEGTVGYGLVNPFTAETIFGEQAKIIQIFDTGLLEDSGAIGTMMTNAGERTWAVEFAPKELVEHFLNNGSQLESIAEHADDEKNSRSIGILTGNAPESGGLLWRKVNEKHRSRLAEDFRGDVSYPDVQVHSRPWMGLSMELSTRSKMIEKRVIQEVKTMSNGGADLIAFACNTTQYYRRQVDAALSDTGSEFVSLPISLEKWLRSKGGSSVFVAGIGYVTEDSNWSAFRFLHSAQNVHLPDQEMTIAITDLAYQVKLNGVDGKSYQKFRSLFRNIRADYFVLLLTELSLIFEKYPRSEFGGLKIVDSMDLYAASIVDASLQKAPIAKDTFSSDS